VNKYVFFHTTHKERIDIIFYIYISPPIHVSHVFYIQSLYFYSGVYRCGFAKSQEACKLNPLFSLLHTLLITYILFLPPTSSSYHLHTLLITYILFLSPTYSSYHVHALHITTYSSYHYTLSLPLHITRYSSYHYYMLFLSQHALLITTCSSYHYLLFVLLPVLCITTCSSYYLLFLLLPSLLITTCSSYLIKTRQIILIGSVVFR